MLVFGGMTALDRTSLLRAWAAWSDRKMECYGTPEGMDAARKANAIMDELEPLDEADWGIIRMAQRGYVREAAND